MGRTNQSRATRSCRLRLRTKEDKWSLQLILSLLRCDVRRLVPLLLIYFTRVRSLLRA